MYREKNDRATTSMLYASHASAKARKLARELRRSTYQREQWDPDALARVAGLIREAGENLDAARDNLAELEKFE